VLNALKTPRVSKLLVGTVLLGHAVHWVSIFLVLLFRITFLFLKGEQRARRVCKEKMSDVEFCYENTDSQMGLVIIHTLLGN
jgi:hypothetical protein